MKSPLMVLLIVILGSLSFPADRNVEEQNVYSFRSSLDQAASFRRLANWVEKNYAYSYCLYSWEGDDRVIHVRQGIGAQPLTDAEGYRKYSYSLDIRISGRDIVLQYRNLNPLKDYRQRAAFRGLNPRNGRDLEWIRRDLEMLSIDIEELMQ